MQTILKNVCLFLILLSISSPTNIFAEFYKYKDPKTGAIRYTDNLAEVPPEQREGINTYDAVEDYQRPEPKKKPSPSPDETAAASEEQENQEDESKPKMTAVEKKALYQELTQERDALDAEYAGIQEIKAALGAEKEKIRTASQLRAYNEKVFDLNVKIEAYDQKRAAHEEKVKSFNEAK